MERCGGGYRKIHCSLFLMYGN